jgi:predicted ATP-grasp superfamily ATP-dependent carboligase
MAAGLRPAPRRPTAVVVALDCITGLQTARILAARGIAVVGIAADRHHFCARTRYAEKVIASPTGGEGLILTLERLAASGSLGDGPAVLVPCSDGAVLSISRWRDRLEAAYRFVLPDHDTVETLMDKVRFAEYASEAGLPIPTTRVLRTPADAEAAAAALTYPAVLKPAIKDQRWFAVTKAKVFRVESADELLATYDQYAPATDVLIAQEWVDGGETSLISANAYFDRSGDALAMFIARKIRQWPPDTGTSCLGEEIRDDEVRDIALRLFGDVGYRGLAYVEVKVDAATGRRLIVEPNVGRPTGRSAIAEQGGVELLHSAYLDALGEPVPATVQTYGGAKWIYWRHDLQAAIAQMRAGRLSPIGWWRSVRGPKYEAVFDRSDMAPFLADVLGTGRAVLAALRRQLTGRVDGAISWRARRRARDVG